MPAEDLLYVCEIVFFCFCGNKRRKILTNECSQQEEAWREGWRPDPDSDSFTSLCPDCAHRKGLTA